VDLTFSPKPSCSCGQLFFLATARATRLLAPARFARVRKRLITPLLEQNSSLRAYRRLEQFALLGVNLVPSKQRKRRARRNVEHQQLSVQTQHPDQRKRIVGFRYR